MNLSHTEHDPLYNVVYRDNLSMEEDSRQHHLWRYTPKISLGHFSRYMQQQKKIFPLLEEFLRSVRKNNMEQACIFILSQIVQEVE